MRLAAVSFLFAGLMAGASFGPADMLGVVNFADEPVISSDGKWVAYSTADGSDQANILARHPTALLWVTPAIGGAAKRILDGDHADTPVWSPDGSKLAFVRWRGTHRKAMVWDATSGAVRELGDEFAEDRSVWPSEGLTLHWTPDGKTLVVAAMQPEAPAATSPRFTVIKSTDAVVPGDVFFVDKRMWKLGTIDVASGSMKYLSPKPFALRNVAIGPDGRTAIFRAVTPETLGHFRAEKVETWLVSLDGSSAPKQVSQSRAWAVFSPDGRELIYPEGSALHARTLDGTDRVLASGFPASTRSAIVSGSWLAVLASRPGTGPQDPHMYSILRPDEDVLVVDLRSGKSKKLTNKTEEIGDLAWGGTNLFYRIIDPATYRETVHKWVAGEESASEVFAGDEALARFSASNNGKLSFTSMTATRPADAFVFDAGKRTTITKLNSQLEKFEFVAPKMFEFYSEDGEKLLALLYRPSGDHVPVVTYTYEKLSSQKNRFNPEAQMHVTHGYAYLEPDILVKPGFTGDSFVKSTVPAVNAVRAMGFTNGKFGITGGSFGGYSGLYMISHVDIFAAAVLRAPPSEFFSTWADGRDRDIWTIDNGQARAVGSPWTSQRSYINNSPFFSADRVHTPVLIMHGEKDYTVPTQQGEMMFYALRYLKRPAELVLYRDGDHSIVRGSRDDYLDYYQRTLDWWGKYLQ
jgi:dipeptidyl aminopeptidase/acylaminoacyl peptidase